MKAFCCWSGGKDCALALHRARSSGIDIICLLNMINNDGRDSRSHGLPSDLLKVQAAAIGSVIIQKSITEHGYEREFKKAILSLKERKVEAGVFGDIYLQEHRDWIERVCKETGIEPVFPLWGIDTGELIRGFVENNFKALIVSVKTEFMGQEWLGREIDSQFINEIKQLSNIDPCGESGEFHTFVYDGPVFNSRVKFRVSKKTFEQGSGFLKINCD